MRNLKFIRGELIPECGHTSHISDWDKNGEEFNRHPDTISGGHVFSMVRERYREEKKYLDKKIPHQNRDIWAYKRAEFWIFCAWMHYYDHVTPENVQLCKDLMDYWDLDESVYAEMRDIAECYKLITPYIQWGNYDRISLSGEMANDKRDLDASIEALIELG